PWEGANYREGGTWHRRVLILGESGYDWEGRPVPVRDATEYCIRDQLAADPDDLSRPRFTKAFFTKIAGAFLDHLPTLPEKCRFWNSVAYYNFTQMLLKGPRKAPNDWRS